MLRFMLEINNIRCYISDMLYFRYLSKNKHVRHIQHYVATCSIGDWFVLYQMSKNMNKRFFAEFLALLSLKVIIRNRLFSKLWICEQG